MIDTLFIAFALLCGLAVGWVFFYGLQRTVQALPHVRRPALLIGLSLLLRLALLWAGLSLLIRVGGQWQHLLAAMVGMLLMRSLLVRRQRPATAPTVAPTAGSKPAPKAGPGRPSP
ncbi:ATP synthase subunit I [Thiohalocapsa marina]|uniref:ATP synthase subunit I n=1 Tax=Thiohalocapsa marina TaxID=424902 RepID=UPI001478950C|nr:ATP synthase subunit I [Thiohalocapsa marina]